MAAGAKKALDSTGWGAVARRVPGANRLIDSTANTLVKIGTPVVVAAAMAPWILVGLVLLLIVGLVVGSIASFASMGTFPLPGEPTTFQHNLMPPGQDPAKPYPAGTKVVDMKEVPGWADVVYHAQQDTHDSRFGVPWTVLAGLARTETDFGRRSPYDAVDRNPHRDPIYGVPPNLQGSAGGPVAAGPYSGPLLLVGGTVGSVGQRLAGSVDNKLSSVDQPGLTLHQAVAQLHTSQMPNMVVGYFGPNETARSAKTFRTDLNRLMTLAGKHRSVYLPTFYAPAKPAIAATINTALQQAAKTHPNLHLIDWAGPAHTDHLVNGDGTPTADGYATLSRKVKAAIDTAGHLNTTPAPHGNATAGTVAYHPAAQPTYTTNAAVNSGNRCEVPDPDPAIGGGKNQAVGPFLLTPEHAATMQAQGLDPQNPCDAADYVAQVLHDTGLDLYATGDYADWQTNDQTAKKLWADTIYNSGLFADPTTGNVACTANVDNDSQVAFAINAIWKCEAAKRHNIETAISATVGSHGAVSFDTVTGTDATAQLTNEALTVAYNYSHFKTNGCNNHARLAGIFPLTKKVADAHGDTDRCDPAANIRAAAEAVLDGETTPVEQRSRAAGPFAPMVGGWSAIPWALGDTAAAFDAQGPVRDWHMSTKCNLAAQMWLTSAAGQLGGFLDAQGHSPDWQTIGAKLAHVAGDPQQGVCTGATDTSYAAQMTEVAQTMSDTLLHPHPTSGTVPATPDPQAPTTTPPGTQPSGPQTPATPSTGLGTVTAPITSPTAAPTSAAGQPSTTPASTADQATARRLLTLARYYQHEAATATAGRATPGHDSMVARLSTGDAAITPAPYDTTVTDIGSFPLADTALGYAVGYGGIRPPWNTASSSVLGGTGAANAVAGVAASGDVALVLAAARSQLGMPYSWGGGGPKGPSTGFCDAINGYLNGQCSADHTVGFDCSGLTEYAYAQIGIDIGTSTYEQVTKGTAVNSLADALPGDLLFFEGTSTAPGHVAIYLGDNKLIEAPHTGETVHITDVYATPVAIRRIVEPTTVGTGGFPGNADAQALATKLRSVGGAGYAAMFVAAGRKHNVDPALLAAVADQESGFIPANVNCSNASSAGAEGIMQFMPATAAGMGFDPCNPPAAIDGAASYIRSLLNEFGNNVPNAMGAYNCGPNCMRAVLSGSEPLPAETQAYMVQVPDKWRRFGGHGNGSAA